jgi:DHA2 family multidrug resistance protein
MGAQRIVISGIIQGLGLGLIFVPLNTLAFGTLAPHYRTTAASLLNLSRSLGGSIGISLMTTLLSRNLQVSHSDLASHITESRSPLIQPALGDPSGVTSDSVLSLINAEINRQAMMIAYIDDFHLMMLICLATLPLVLLLRKSSGPGPAVMAD